jgi:hypothetical protein
MMIIREKRWRRAQISSIGRKLGYEIHPRSYCPHRAPTLNASCLNKHRYLAKNKIQSKQDLLYWEVVQISHFPKKLKICVLLLSVHILNVKWQKHIYLSYEFSHAETSIFKWSFLHQLWSFYHFGLRWTQSITWAQFYFHLHKFIFWHLLRPRFVAVAKNLTCFHFKKINNFKIDAEMSRIVPFENSHFSITKS